ncbi:hypothetical protein ABIE44_001971 [Marmoricola sp. OAE513]|uniref:hypothetical protein n=1 Tax=Marmoricola sp. OAE513 TaxID=2817894 RepID=UPI001AE4C1EE
MKPGSRSTRAEYASRACAGILLVAGWLVLGYGLRYSPSDAAAIDELEGGGSFGVAFGLTLPYYAMALGMIPIGLAALFPRFRDLQPLTVAIVSAGLFGVWALNWRDVYGVLLELPVFAVATVWLLLASGAALLVARKAQATLTPERSSPP